MKTLIKLAKIIIPNKLLTRAYLIRGKKLLQDNKVSEAFWEFKKGAKFSPNNYEINIALRELANQKEDWNSALKYWKILYTFHKDKYAANDFLENTKAHMIYDNIEEALEVLEYGHINYPENKALLRKIIDISISNRKWEKSIPYLTKYLELETTPSIEQILNLIIAYENVGNNKEAKALIQIALKEGSITSEALEELIEVDINKRDWENALYKLHVLIKIDKTSESLIKLGMVYQITGNSKKSQEIFDNLFHELSDSDNNESGYRKITVFDNGESRIEYYKKLKSTSMVMITFDSINMEWNERPFASKLLMKHNLDIVAVRKRKRQTYQQDLLHQDFVNVVKPIVVGYKDKMSYGFSLGAYNALHFASILNCRILALSPRLSIHPIYGRTKIIPKYKMKHNLSHPFNDQISPIIVFDPKNALDNKYINEEIIKSFPNSILVRVPYSGHGIAPFLLEVGQLKEFVNTFIGGEVPKYNRRNRVQSAVYFKNLGEECLKHNKLNWALLLAQHSIEMDKSDYQTIKLKIKVLKRLGRLEEAVEFIYSSLENVPQVLDIRMYLVDILMELGDHTQAETEIQKAKKLFGDRKPINKRLNTLTNRDTQ